MLLLGAVVLITTLQQNSSQKKLFEKKKIFVTVFIRKTNKGLTGIFAGHIELYLNPKVHEK